jgi:2,4-dienoyl-CoA reductase-like NADH-dependent reductase (Old Yellow Enzyme family)
MAMPALFSPLKLRGLTLRNRVVLSPMCQYSAVDGLVQDWHHQHHARFASGGIALGFVEATGVTRDGRITHGCTGIWNDAQVPGLRRITDLYRSYGAASGIQIGHAGRRASAERPWDGAAPIKRNDGPEAAWERVAPSAIPERDGYPAPRALTEAEIEELIGAFTAATRRALAAGFDVVEIHGAHGYLIHSFFSPISNQRNDAFGGGLEKRMRFPLRVAEAVRAAWPAEKPLFYRASFVDGVPDGTTAADTVALAKELKARGVDAYPEIERELVALAAAEQIAERQAGRLAEDVPAGHVDRHLGIGMALQRTVHRVIDELGAAGIEPDHGGGDQRQRRSHAFAIGGKIAGAEAALLAPADQALIGFDADDGGILLRRGLAAGHREGAADDGVALGEDVDAGDAHQTLGRRGSAPGPSSTLARRDR